MVLNAAVLNAGVPSAVVLSAVILNVVIQIVVIQIAVTLNGMVARSCRVSTALKVVHSEAHCAVLQCAAAVHSAAGVHSVAALHSVVVVHSVAAVHSVPALHSVAALHFVPAVHSVVVAPLLVAGHFAVAAFQWSALQGQCVSRDVLVQFVRDPASVSHPGLSLQAPHYVEDVLYRSPDSQVVFVLGVVHH